MGRVLLIVCEVSLCEVSLQMELGRKAKGKNWNMTRMFLENVVLRAMTRHSRCMMRVLWLKCSTCFSNFLPFSSSAAVRLSIKMAKRSGVVAHGRPLPNAHFVSYLLPCSQPYSQTGHPVSSHGRTSTLFLRAFSSSFWLSEGCLKTCMRSSIKNCERRYADAPTHFLCV